MQCHACDVRAIITGPPRCREHFVEEFERRVQETIERFELVRPGQKVAVACSGGKDSLTVLTLLKKWHDDVTAIVVDEGIAGYREHTIEDLERVCGDLGVPIVRTSYEELTGMTLDEILKKNDLGACTVCGTFRRHLLSVASKPFDVLATGHNADDETQTVLMNLVRGNTELFPRNGPKTGVGAAGFTQRVKPLYFCTEKEVMTYAYLHGLTSSFIQCPNAPGGYRWGVREELNRLVQKRSAARQELIERFLIVKESFPTHDVELPHCGSCGEPSARPTCKTCEFMEKIGKKGVTRSSRPLARPRPSRSR